MSVLSRATGTAWAARANDFYATIDARAIAALAPHIPAGTIYAEPCAGAGDLVHLLAGLGLQCAWACDIAPQCRTVGQWDAMQLCPIDVAGVECFITNPPWTRPLLHPLIGGVSPSHTVSQGFLLPRYVLRAVESEGA